MSIINTKQTVKYVTERDALFHSSIDEDTELTVQEYMQIQNVIIESMIDMEFVEEEFQEYLEEGANIQYTKKFGALIANYRRLHKEFRKSVKAKDYAAAHGYIREMKKAVKDMESGIKDIDSTVFSTIVSYILNGFVIWFQQLIPSFAICVGNKLAFPGARNAAGATSKAIKQGFSSMSDIFGNASNMSANDFEKAVDGAMGTMSQQMNDISNSMPDVGPVRFKVGTIVRRVGKIAKFINRIMILISEIKSIIASLREGDRAVNAFNVYRNKLLSFAKELSKWIDRLDASLKEKENAERNGEE